MGEGGFISVLKEGLKEKINPTEIGKYEIFNLTYSPDQEENEIGRILRAGMDTGAELYQTVK